MTKEELAALTPEQKRIRILEACGWKRRQDADYTHYKSEVRAEMWQRPNCGENDIVNSILLPDPLNDLNACHEMEKVLDSEKVAEYFIYIANMTHHPTSRNKASNWSAHATAAQRCDAFLLTMP